MLSRGFLTANGEIWYVPKIGANNRKSLGAEFQNYPRAITVVWMSMHNKAKMNMIRYIENLNNSRGNS